MDIGLAHGDSCPPQEAAALSLATSSGSSSIADLAATPAPGGAAEVRGDNSDHDDHDDAGNSCRGDEGGTHDDTGPATGNTQAKRKTAEIVAACDAGDIGLLRSLAEDAGGFLNDGLRRRAWPILLGLHGPNFAGCDDVASEWMELPRHQDEDQVQLDVNRSFIYYPNDLTDVERDQRKSELSALIREVLRRFPFLCYFQGYHDISQVLLLVLDQHWRSPMLARLSLLRIRDFMLPSFGPTTTQLRLLPDILDKADPKLRKHVGDIEPFYALAGTLTMYAHNIERYRDISRLFDVFLAREPVFSIYVFAQIIIDRRDEILEEDEPDMLHVILGRVPPKMDLDSLIVKAANLFERCPPEGLWSWRFISNSSALKTARNVEASAGDTLEKGQQYFHKQVKELQWMDMHNRVKASIWAYRRPARLIVMAVAAAAVSYYLRRNPSMVNSLVAFFSR